MTVPLRLRPLRLKDFQQATVDYVFQRLYDDSEPASRFLIADEVGLGKTLCARGLIARTIEKLQEEGVPRIDVVYVCSNVDIARQNIARLNPTYQEDFHLAGRITLLPLHLRHLSSNPVNFVSFTPGTSLDLKSTAGTVEERAVLYWLLRRAWGARAVGGVGAKRLLAVDANVTSLDWWIGSTRGKLDREPANAFSERLEGDDAPGLRERFNELKRRLAARKSGLRQVDRDDRRRLVGDLRNLLAGVCVHALEPDLIILDEFQRFKHLLDPNNPAGELAQQLFQYEGARVVLLSATPYKMYTVAEDVSDDHYADFIKTLEFLLGVEEAARFRSELRVYREALLTADEDGIEAARGRKQVIEASLGRVMVRTERLASTPDRNGMLVERDCEALRLHPTDLRSYVALDRLAQRLGAGDVLEYWKSTPYLLNFMEEYKLAKALESAEHGVSRQEVTALVRNGIRLISWDAFEGYRPIDAGNSRMRSMWHDTIESGAWRLLWIPASLPYYESGAPYDDPKLAGFTKRLVFSAWTVVPKAIASLVSYEAERRVMAGRRRRNTAEEREKVRPLLRFAKSKGRLVGMPALALLYPSPVLAELADPRDLAGALSSDGTIPKRRAAMDLARERVAGALAPLLDVGEEEGVADDRWYWATPFLLDRLRDSDAQEAWLDRWDAASAWVGTSGEAGERSALAEHVAEAFSFAGGEKVTDQLGRPPDDLVDVVAQLALAGPGVCGLRALSRVVGGRAALDDLEIRDAAARVAWGLRSLLNTPEAMMLIRSGGQRAYWRRVLAYALAGNLQSVLDEYAHVLVEWLGLTDRDKEDVARGVAEAMYDALSLRRVGYVARDLSKRGPDGRFPRRRMPGRFALRFSDEHGDDGQAVNRHASVHGAFNSPFWPFVLASTSVGQEGLDFHLYSHAVVHWNLPANPVDLEQREGRVHRYKGHAVRKNVAATCRASAFAGDDPWEGLFTAAEDLRPEGQSEIMPSWVFQSDDGAQIERYVPALPLSRDQAKLADLKRGLAIYRLAFGQPRQEDLVIYLRRRFSEEEIEQLLEEFRIDLSPIEARR